MKKGLITALFLLLFVFSSFINITNVRAKSFDNGMQTIKNVEEISENNASIYAIKFTKNLNEFGFKSKICNNNKIKVTINIISTYYDKDRNLIASSEKVKELEPKTIIEYSNMENINILKAGYSVDDIVYYDVNATVIIDPIFLHNHRIEYYQENPGYIIDGYDVNINVNENNTYDVTEIISVYFYEPKEYFLRTISLIEMQKRVSDSGFFNRAKITNIKVDNDEFTTKGKMINQEIKITPKSESLIGEQKFIVRYTYDVGKDNIRDADKFSYLITGQKWNTIIGNINFKINMPKKFDPNRTEIFAGFYGGNHNEDENKVIYNIDNNTIVGSYDGILQAEHEIATKIYLKDGYFINKKGNFNFLTLLSIILPIIFTLISHFILKKHQYKTEDIINNPFYPPQGINSLEAGFFYKGRAEMPDLVSLLIYLANKGYIKISEIPEKSLLKRTPDFRITKLKEYTGTNKNEKYFFNGLFYTENSLMSSSVNTVTLSELHNKYYVIKNRILANMNEEINKKKVFEETAIKKKKYINLMLLITYCLIITSVMYTYGDIINLLKVFAYSMIGFCGISLSTLNPIYAEIKTKKTMLHFKTIFFFIGIMFTVISNILLVVPLLLEDYNYLVIYILGIICIIKMILYLKKLSETRTKYGEEVLNHLKKFKEFIESDDKNRVKSITMQDPNYFYNMLPYAYVLGVSDKWFEKLDLIGIQKPIWYESFEKFDATKFNSLMFSAQKELSSCPSSSYRR